MKRALVLYIPVLHAGYIKLFEKYRRKVDTLFVIGNDLKASLDPNLKEIRSLEPLVAVKLVSGFGIFKSVRLLTEKGAQLLAKRGASVVTADETISRRFAEKYLKSAQVAFEPVFLRWDEENVLRGHPPKNVHVSKRALDRAMIKAAAREGNKSSDWWRRVGAVIVKSGKVLLRNHNQHLPSEHSAYAEGDPRDFIKAGVTPEITTAMHAEQMVIAEAAERGIRLHGASLYTNVFPCAMCAKLVAYSGIKRCYFSSGSATLDGERVLKSRGVELILVR